MQTTTYYISSGKKNAMYTLRVQRTGSGSGYGYSEDSYICNLANDRARAEEKAEDYVARLRTRLQESDTYKVTFDLEADFNLFERRSTLSVLDTQRMQQVEAGLFPWGKRVGTAIADAPDSAILFFADKAKEENGAVFAAVCAACLGVALERDLIAKRDAVRAERRAQDELSQFIGAVGERRVFEGELFMCYETKDGDFPTGLYVNKIRQGDDVVFYFGKKLGEKGEQVKMKATIVKHDLYNGMKSTKVNRPAKA